MTEASRIRELEIEGRLQDAELNLWNAPDLKTLQATLSVMERKSAYANWHLINRAPEDLRWLLDELRRTRAALAKATGR